ncbi:MAG: indolepyruvate ferredoxin oxidoreductase [Chloroflexi bacterium RBG_13_60_13]|nr:MAG: indolepyruvate ferredoxin oxidoreductase [Chloroflexi bacterium RBG_13_60_13]
MEGKDPLNVIVTGVGGQGNVLISQFMGGALVRAGYHVTIGETYGASQRGGAVMSHLRISRQAQYGPLIPHGQGDAILGLEPLETLRVLGQYGNPGVTVVSNSRPVYPLAVATGIAHYPTVDEIVRALNELSSRAWLINATDIALELGPAILANIVMVGALVGAGVLPLGAEEFELELQESLPDDRLDLNLKAFRRGLAEVQAR